MSDLYFVEFDGSCQPIFKHPTSFQITPKQSSVNGARKESQPCGNTVKIIFSTPQPTARRHLAVLWPTRVRATKRCIWVDFQLDQTKDFKIEIHCFHD